MQNVLEIVKMKKKILMYLYDILDLIIKIKNKHDTILNTHGKQRNLVAKIIIFQKSSIKLIFMHELLVVQNLQHFIQDDRHIF